MKIYLVHGTHPVLPNEVEFAHGTLAAANAAALALVNSLREIPTDDDAACMPPLEPGADWQLGLDSWQRDYLVGKLGFGYSRIADMPDADVSIAMGESGGGDVWIVEMDVDVPPVRVVIGMAGGCFTDAFTDAPDGAVRILIVDYDAGGEEGAVMIDGQTAKVRTATPEPVDPFWIDGLESPDSDAAFLVEPAALAEPETPVEPAVSYALTESFVEAGRTAERVDIGTRTTDSQTERRGAHVEAGQWLRFSCFVRPGPGTTHVDEEALYRAVAAAFGDGAMISGAVLIHEPGAAVPAAGRIYETAKPHKKG